MSCYYLKRLSCDNQVIVVFFFPLFQSDVKRKYLRWFLLKIRFDQLWRVLLWSFFFEKLTVKYRCFQGGWGCPPPPLKRFKSPTTTTSQVSVAKKVCMQGASAQRHTQKKCPFIPVRKVKNLFPSTVWLHFPAAGGAAQHLSGEQKEIIDKHNQFRRSVNPTASNMLEMVTSSGENREKDFHRLDLQLARRAETTSPEIAFPCFTRRNGAVRPQPTLRNGPTAASWSTAPRGAEPSAVRSTLATLKPTVAQQLLPGS